MSENRFRNDSRGQEQGWGQQGRNRNSEQGRYDTGGNSGRYQGSGRENNERSEISDQGIYNDRNDWNEQRQRGNWNDQDSRWNTQPESFGSYRNSGSGGQYGNSDQQQSRFQSENESGRGNSGSWGSPNQHNYPNFNSNEFSSSRQQGFNTPEQNKWQGANYQGNDWSNRFGGSYDQGINNYGRYQNESSLLINERGSLYNPGGPHKGKGPKGYQRSDERIKEDVCDRLMEDGLLDATGIEVEVENNEVILSGVVNDRQAKRRAEELCESIPGVNNVENRLHLGQQQSAERRPSAAPAQNGDHKNGKRGTLSPTS